MSGYFVRFINQGMNGPPPTDLEQATARLKYTRCATPDAANKKHISSPHENRLFMCFLNLYLMSVSLVMR